MTDFLIVPSVKGDKVNEKWKSISKNTSYDVFYDGLVYVRESEGVTCLVIGSPYLNFNENDSIENFCERALNYFRSGDADKIELYGFATLIFVEVEKISIFTDREGYRPIYHSQNQAHKPIVASRISNVTKTLGGAKLNEEYVDFALIFGFYPADQTVVKNTLKSSASFVYTLGGDFSLHSQKNDSSSSNDRKSESPEISLEEAKIKLANQLEASISNIKHIDSKVAVLLGGFDSALVAAIASKVGLEVETFSFFYKDAKYNQAKVDELCDMYGFKHHWIEIDESILKNGLDDYSDNYSTPSNWPHYIIQSDYLAQKIKDRGFKVILTGDGCDGIFQGYPQLYRSAKFNNEKNILDPLFSVFKTMFDFSYFEKKFGHVYRLGMRFYRNSRVNNPEKTYLMYRICDESTISRIFGSKTSEVEARISKIISSIRSSISNIPYTRLAYLGRSNMGPNRTKINGIVDNYDLHLFSPYMHWMVKEFVSSLPEEFMRPKGGKSDLNDIGKFLLTKMAEDQGYLTNEIIYQPKVAAVDAPIDDWYEEELNEYVRDLVDGSESITGKEFVYAMAKPKLAEKMYRKYISADAVTSHALSVLLTTIKYEK